MKHVAALAIAALLAACGKAEAPAPTDTAADATERSAPAPSGSASAGGVSIGTTSGLTSQTSALTGAVSDFLVERTATKTRVQLAADTLFDFDKATLSSAAQGNLQRTADLVRAGGSGTVTVIGHTDAKGEEPYNIDLSRRRAEAVVAWLRSQPGLDGRSFEAIGRGEAEPIAANANAAGEDDPDGRARNRRVEVNIPR